MEEAPRRINPYNPAPDYEEQERRAKSKKLMLAVIVAIIVVAAFLLLNPLKKAEPAQQFIDKASATLAAANIAGGARPAPFILEFEKQEVELNGKTLNVEHNLRIDENGRRETLAFTNTGDEPVEFTLIQVTPAEVYDSNYSENSTTLKFADADAGAETAAANAAAPAPAVVETRRVTLQPGEVFTTRVYSTSSKQVGLLFIPVLNTAGNDVNADELRAILEQAASDGRVNVLALTPQNANSLSVRITSIVNSDKTWIEKKAELENALASVERAETSAEFVFTATASEALPASYIEIPLFLSGESESELGAPLIQAVEGELAPYVVAGYPKIEVDSNGVKKAEILFDFRRATLRGGLFWDDATGSELQELSGTLSFSFSKRAETTTSVPLRVEFNHVYDSSLFLSASPRLIEFTARERTTSATTPANEIKKPVFLTNSYEFPVSVSGCSFPENTVVQPHETKHVLLDYDDVVA
jgi:hypothetical protein